MRKNLTNMHTLRRTSPKGEEFVGICCQCGLKMSLKESMNSRCENIIGLDQKEALQVALEDKTQ